MLLVIAVTTYSTAAVARMVGIHKVTLQRWMLAGKIREPRRVKNGGINVRIWTDQDVERVRRYKEKFYWKGGGRKPKLKR